MTERPQHARGRGPTSAPLQASRREAPPNLPGLVLIPLVSYCIGGGRFGADMYVSISKEGSVSLAEEGKGSTSTGGATCIRALAGRRRCCLQDGIRQSREKEGSKNKGVEPPIREGPRGCCWNPSPGPRWVWRAAHLVFTLSAPSRQKQRSVWGGWPG